MTPRPFLLRLLLPFGLIMALIVGICGAAIYFANQQAVRVEQIRQLDNLTALVRPWVAADPEALGEERQAQLRAAAEALRTRVTLIDGGGRVFFDTHGVAPAMENHNDRPEVVAARQGGSGSDVRTSRTIREGSVYVAKLLDPNDRTGTVVRLSYPQRYWADLRTPAWTVLVAGVVCAMLATAVLAGLLLRQWINPVRALASAAERMAAGEWDVRATPRGAEDLRLFSGRLNVVAAQAQKQLADLRDQRADLAALVDTLPDPFLVIDAQRRILLMNAPAAALLQLTAEQAVGQTVDAVVNEAGILDLFERRGRDDTPGVASAAADGQALRPRLAGAPQGAPAPEPREIRLTREGQRLVYQAMVTPTAAGGVLLVLRDVSALANAVQMKADFVANASHELRTPIAAIKIAFETLRDVYTEDPPQAERCITIIDEHIRRLEEMLRDLLDLSRVESPDLKPHLVDVKAADLFALLRSTMGPVARQKGVELNFVDGETRLLSDERLLNLVLKNLVENSIKFTPAGGRVTVSVHAGQPATPDAPGPVTLRVADTGVGIPPEHIDRVFERFYQVGAARSGSAGRGTGLGLAIVKHAVAALGGAVDIDSAPGEGTTVTCVLPQNGAA